MRLTIFIAFLVSASSPLPATNDHQTPDSIHAKYEEQRERNQQKLQQKEAAALQRHLRTATGREERIDAYEGVMQNALDREDWQRCASTAAEFCREFTGHRAWERIWRFGAASLFRMGGSAAQFRKYFELANGLDRDFDEARAEVALDFASALLERGQLAESAGYLAVARPLVTEDSEDELRNRLTSVQNGFKLRQEPLPDSKWTAMDGSEISIGNYRGRVILLDFWTSWCAYCRDSVPMLKQLQREFGERGLEILGVAMDDDPKDAAEAVRKDGITWRQIEGSAFAHEPAGALFDVPRYPYFVIIDQSGQARYIDTPVKELNDRISELLARKK